MNEQTGAIRTAAPAPPSDPVLRHRRIAALRRAHRARQILDHEAELAARYGADDPADDDGAAPRPDPYQADVERLQEIHRHLRHERHVARRPFHRHSERLVLALELAERLALDRLGFDDFADFEAHVGDGRAGREIIDLDHLERAQRELADAEAVLAELDAATSPRPPVVRLPPWTVDPVLRTPAQLRATRARRQVFGDDRRLTVAPPPEPMARPLPLRRLPRDIEAIVTSPDGRAGARGRVGRADGQLLGEIVHNGRVMRVEKIGGLVYGDDSDGPGADGISYGDPNRPD